MNQKLAVSVFFSGLAVFLTSLGEFFAVHDTWHAMTTPTEVGHVMIMAGSFVVTIAGALGTQLPRDPTRFTDRVSDSKVADINQKDGKNGN